MTVKTSRLQDMRIYLSGACECAPETGADWRKEVTPPLVALGLTVFDPVHSDITLPCGISKQEEFIYVKKLREEGNYSELEKIMKEITHMDCRMCDCADILLVYLDSTIQTTGTIHEIIISVMQKKPIYVACKQGKKHIPLWLFGIIPHTYMFETLTEAVQELTKISKTSDKDLKTLDNKRWLFVNGIK